MDTQKEAWKMIDGFSKYDISNLGRIRTHNWYGSGKTVIMKPAHDMFGYYRTMILGDDGKSHTVKIHRLVAKMFIPNPHKYPHVNHLNCVRDDNRMENLEWCSPKQNTQHSIEHGEFYKCLRRGSDNGNSKLIESDVCEIREKYDPGVYSLNRLAREYGVSKKLILLIVKNKIWNHVQSR